MTDEEVIAVPEITDSLQLVDKAGMVSDTAPFCSFPDEPCEKGEGALTGRKLGVSREVPDAGIKWRREASREFVGVS